MINPLLERLGGVERDQAAFATGGPDRSRIHEFLPGSFLLGGDGHLNTRRIILNKAAEDVRDHAANPHLWPGVELFLAEPSDLFDPRECCVDTAGRFLGIARWITAATLRVGQG